MMGIAAGGIMLGSVFSVLRRSRHARAESGVDALRSNRPLPQRALGKTGVAVSVFALGGEARIEQPQYLPIGGADAIINRALDLGVNYIDTSAWYGRGTSERNIGRVLQTRRNDVFLATKSHERSYDGTMRLAEQSLKNLRTDTIDLYQVHDIRTHEDLDRVFAADGAIRAMEQLRSAGVIRFIGITGHYDAAVLLRGIREYEFDTILLSLNAADIHQQPFQKELLTTAVEKQMGVLAMKVLAKGRLLRPDGITSMEQALGYVLSFPVSAAVVGISSIEEIEQNVRIASSLRLPYDAEELSRLERLALSATTEGNWFKRQV